MSALEPTLTSVRGRGLFALVRAEGTRVRSGALRTVGCRVESDSTGPLVQVGFSIGRRTGNAVTRNRVRRRTREALRVVLLEGEVGPQDGFRRIREPLSVERPHQPGSLLMVVQGSRALEHRRFLDLQSDWLAVLEAIAALPVVPDPTRAGVA